MKLLPAIRQEVRQVLQDEFSDISELVWKDDELEQYIQDINIQISEVQPYEKRVTVVSDGTKEIDLSALTEYPDLISVVKAEYPVGSDRQEFRNVERFGDSLTLKIDNAPTSDEDIYLYCNLVHTLNDNGSTLNRVQESLLVKGACGQAAISKSRKYIDTVNTGGNSVPDRLFNWGRGRLDEFKAGLKSRVRQSGVYATD